MPTAFDAENDFVSADGVLDIARVTADVPRVAATDGVSRTVDVVNVNVNVVPDGVAVGSVTRASDVDLDVDLRKALRN